MEGAGKARGLGELSSGGVMFHVPLHLVRKILSPECPLLELIGKAVRFEVTCGLNGRIWLKSHTVKDTIAICNCIFESFYVPNIDMADYISKWTEKFRA